MAVTIPVLFLLYDYYVDGYLDRKRLQEKIPLLFLSFVFGIIAIIAQYSTGITSKDPSFNLLKSCFLVPYGLVFYSVKYIFPFALSPVYPYPETVGASYPILFWLSPFIVAGLGYGLFRLSVKNRLLIFALLFYIVSILPVLQFIPVGRAIAADRFSYIPLLGLMLATGQGFNFFWIHSKSHRWIRILLLMISLSVVGGLLSMTQQQLSIWRTDKTLWSRVVQDNPLYAEGYNNLGISLASEGKLSEALGNFNRAIVLDSTDTEYFYNRGLLFLQMERWRDAIQDFSCMIVLHPQDLSGYALRGNAYLENKSYRESIADYTQVLQSQPLAFNIRLKRIQAMVGNEDYAGALEDIDFLNVSGVQVDSALVNKVRDQAHSNLKSRSSR